MFAEILKSIRNDFVSQTLVTFVGLYTIYMLVARAHLYLYQRENRRKPVHYRMFRLYSKSLISNAPSKKEKQFYIATNRLTWFFNTVMIVAFFVYLMKVFL